LNILLIRFSAMGDVALLSPVVFSALSQNPDLHITLLTRKTWQPLFPYHPRLHFEGVDFSPPNKGVRGIYCLWRRILALSPDVIIDEHDVLRTRLLRGLLFFSGKKVRVFQKGREEKSSWVKKKVKSAIPELQHTTERYADPLRALGYSLTIRPEDLPAYGRMSKPIEAILEKYPQSSLRIGIAPMAKHESKIWGIERVRQCMKILTEREPRVRFFLLGGKEDREILAQLGSTFDHCLNIAGLFTLDEELALIGQLHAVLSMDSANMHLAALCRTPVVSVWGGTHPNLGFSPLFNKQWLIQPELPCRPATVYGKVTESWQKECYETAFDKVSPDEVADKLFLAALSKQAGTKE
jgi:ADP-heptose:LPS heptosyltransferase